MSGKSWCRGPRTRLRGARPGSRFGDARREAGHVSTKGLYVGGVAGGDRDHQRADRAAAGVLKAVKRQADKTVCASNLRQIGTALLMYAQDNRGRLPEPSHRLSRHSEDWVYWQPKRDIQQSRIWPYIGKSAKVLVCPSGLAKPVEEGEYPFSYSLSFAAISWGLPDGNSFKITLSKVREPGHKLLLVEEDSLTIDDGDWNAYGGTGGNTGYVSARHDLASKYAGKPFYSALSLGSGHAISFDGSYLWIKRHWARVPYYYDPLYVGPFKPFY